MVHVVQHCVLMAYTAGHDSSIFHPDWFDHLVQNFPPTVNLFPWQNLMRGWDIQNLARQYRPRSLCINLYNELHDYE